MVSGLIKQHVDLIHIFYKMIITIRVINTFIISQTYHYVCLCVGEVGDI